MIVAEPIVLLLLFMPILVFYQAFRKDWADSDLRKGALIGFLSGIFCITLTRLAYYPIEWFIGSDLRSFLSAPREWWVTLLASIGIIGLVEESVKAGGGLIASYMVPFNKRPTIVFMSFAGCALGFSFFENIQYYIIFGSSVVLPRLIISSTAHVFFACLCAAITAAALSRPKPDSIISLRILAGILTAAMFHGLFDFLIFRFHLQTISGIIVTCVAIFLFGIYEAWVAVLKIDTQTCDGLMQCSACESFSIGSARYCNFCGGRVVQSKRSFTIKIAE